MRGAWPKIHLRDVARITAGKGAPQGADKYGSSGLPFVRAGSLEMLIQGKPESDLEHIADDVAKQHHMRIFPSGSLLFAKSGMSAMRGLVYCLQQPCYVVSHLAVIMPEDQINSGFLGYWLRANPPTHLIRDESYPSIPLSDIESLTVPLPPLAEQKRIASILDKADAIRRKRRESIRLADDFIRAAFLDMFGDPVTNPKGWMTRKLTDIADIASGVTKGRKYGDSKTVEVPYMRVANVQDGEIRLDDVTTITVLPEEAERYALSPGDILLTEGGDPDKLGRGAVWRGQVAPCIHQNHIFRVRLHKGVGAPEFISAILSSALGKRYFFRCAKQTTGIASINMTQLKQCPVLLPPVDRQESYAALLQRVRASVAHTAMAAKDADMLFQSLAQNAFAGIPMCTDTYRDKSS